jgi:hypothetical protein
LRSSMAEMKDAHTLVPHDRGVVAFCMSGFPGQLCKAWTVKTPGTSHLVWAITFLFLKEQLKGIIIMVRMLTRTHMHTQKGYLALSKLIMITAP